MFAKCHKSQPEVQKSTCFVQHIQGGFKNSERTKLQPFLVALGLEGLSNVGSC